MPDGNEWDIPVEVVIRHRAQRFAHKFRGNVSRSMAEDTLPLFRDPQEIIKWASTQMRWRDVVSHARLVRTSIPLTEEEKQIAWATSAKKMITLPGSSYETL